MSISLATITGYAGSGRIILNAQQTGIESAGFVHRLKSFFNIGDAREKNRATLNALKEAVLTDPRFNTLDLQDEVERLFEKESTRFAVDMSRIRGIMSKMATLANQHDVAMLDKRVDMHMAAITAGGGRVFSPDQKVCVSEVTHIVKQQVRQAAAAGGRAPVDVADIAMDVCGLAATAFMEIGDMSQTRDPELLDFVGRHLRQFAVRGNLTLRSSDEVASLVRDTCDFFRRARVMGDGQDGFTHSTSAPANRVGPHASAALEFMNTVGRPLKHGLYDSIDEYVYPRSEQAERMLGTNPTEAQVRSMVDAMAQDMSDHPILDSDSGAPVFGKDDAANRALARYMGKTMALGLSDPACQAICKSLHVKSASEVFEKMAYISIFKRAH